MAKFWINAAVTFLDVQVDADTVEEARDKVSEMTVFYIYERSRIALGPIVLAEQLTEQFLDLASYGVATLKELEKS